MKFIQLSLLSLLLTGGVTVPASAQDKVVNAFDDLSRQGVVQEKDSPMRKRATPDQMAELLRHEPQSGYFCFTEDRSRSARLTDAIPECWALRPADKQADFKGTAQPGEFYTYQIALYSPSLRLDDVHLQFSDLRGSGGQRIPADSMRCFNLGGIDIEGNHFTKRLDVAPETVQSLWCGIGIPASQPAGTYTGYVTVKPDGKKATRIPVAIEVKGTPLAHSGTDEGWRMARLKWLDSRVGVNDMPTAPYTPITVTENSITYLGGELKLEPTGLPGAIATFYNQENQLDPSLREPVLASPAQFEIETAQGIITMPASKFSLKKTSDGRAEWSSRSENKDFIVEVTGFMEFDGFSDLNIRVTPRRGIEVRDIRLNVPYTKNSSQLAMGLGRKGGLIDLTAPDFVWDTTKHQDALWLGAVNAGLNLKFKDPNNYQRPLVNVYYGLGRLRMPDSWGNGGQGRIQVENTDGQVTTVIASTGERTLKKGEALNFGVEMLITPVKPLDMEHHITERFYHSNSDLSNTYIPAAKAAGANFINIHHKKEIYPYINYPYFDDCAGDFKAFADSAAAAGIGTRVYYTTRELTVKVPEIWALRSLGGEVIHDGPGKDARTLIHKNGPNQWLVDNFTTHFIPAWYNAFNQGKYKGEMDISVITTPDSRWNNYYLEGLDWMIRNYGLRGAYIDDSALDRVTLKRARHILDNDGTRRQIDIHSWNHMNQWAGYANSLHMYLDLLPYVDRTWIGEGFKTENTPDFWLVEMSGIPFGLMSETLDAHNIWRGMVFCMAPRLPWSGNPAPLWKLWDKVGMKDAVMLGWWDYTNNPTQSDNKQVLATTYKLPGGKALVAVANWTDTPQAVTLTLDAGKLGFTPTKVTLPEMETLQTAANVDLSLPMTVTGKGGLIILVE